MRMNATISRHERLSTVLWKMQQHIDAPDRRRDIGRTRRAVPRTGKYDSAMAFPRRETYSLIEAGTASALLNGRPDVRLRDDGDSAFERRAEADGLETGNDTSRQKGPERSPADYANAPEVVMARLHCPTPGLPGAVVLLVVSLLAACGESDGPAQQKDAGAIPPTTAESAAATTRPRRPAVDACALLTTAEVEAAAGRPVMEPVEDHTAPQHSICSYGESGSPRFAGKPGDLVAELSVLTGDTNHGGGAAAQVNAVFDMITRNAGGVQTVEGLGERAHWVATFDTLRTVQDHYMLEVTVSERDSNGDKIAGDPREIAEQLTRTMLERLP
jgi:hypothetical protein